MGGGDPTGAGMFVRGPMLNDALGIRVPPAWQPHCLFPVRSGPGSSVVTIPSRGRYVSCRQAAVGFEPTNNGFANRRLRPLGYAALVGWR